MTGLRYDVITLFRCYPDGFTDPEDQGGDADDEQPRGERKGLDIEKSTSKSDYQHLTDKYQSGNEQESLTALQVQGRTARGKGSGIEHVPELQHHEDGEERRVESGELRVES